MIVKLKNVVKLMRPHQYVKNLFIFLPLFFDGQITDLELLKEALLAFIAFSFTASSIYILNDYLDIAADLQHPAKKHRPLASGLISKKEAILLFIAFLAIGIVLISIQNTYALYVLLAYVALNIAYCFVLKHVAILDITVIAIGFVLRLFIGSFVTGVPLSKWIVIMTFLLALFLALAKRRDDVLHFLDTGAKMRKVIDGYNLKLIDAGMMIMASTVIVTYILYTTSTEVIARIQNEYLYLTSFFVILGILRYSQLSLLENNSGSPSKIILTDRFLILTILAWVFSFVWIIYLNNNS
ncbi:MAG: decaprenyl-phosphate phosphoribosyltransferase [Flavobacteriaceae bacterium]|nr:decaprenyl-phosphate phosphoribosyltransferase [Flavobacteriaceae bacterium]